MNAAIQVAINCAVRAALLTVAVAGATQNVPLPAQGKPLLIIGATLHTVSGAVIENGKMCSISTSPENSMAMPICAPV